MHLCMCFVCVHGSMMMQMCTCEQQHRMIIPLYTQVVKKSGDILMTAKAFNGRVISEWLGECLRQHAGAGAFADERIPLMAGAMILSCINR